MRTPDQMMEQILSFAKFDSRIRLVGMEGSRVNSNIPSDQFQDFDVTYFVTDISSFTVSDEWLAPFGPYLIMQKPEDMELFPPEEAGYSYLILFEDFAKMDLTLLSVDQLASYLQVDSLRTILLDKDGCLPQAIVPSDVDYRLQKPSSRSFDDCCNEFWNIAPYVVKGICRKEFLYAVDHLHLMRSELLRMLSWQAGVREGFTVSMGKNYKFLDKHIPAAQWKKLISTYREDNLDALWASLFACAELFREASGKTALALGYSYPSYDRNVTKYIDFFFQEYSHTKRNGDQPDSPHTIAPLSHSNMKKRGT